ncbi:hypothetical protein EDD90_2086 [Streptomyces sp. Ag109_O5-1]|uniref:hypothetical protein n=1 Tax=Streptomyces sp. Ag109_O5-1 TaxID=1938851 RepID=UPI000F4EE4A5|nr:hypothetical protein [Streptomyces sp. Ag109_O5-1]RPE39122.1 hypothetical protein EDD90_2086 [Streptomyces sp. Ag109_O5-1]
MNHSRTSNRRGEAKARAVSAQVERLREALAETAYEITPSSPPLAAVQLAGRRRRLTRRVAVLGVGCGLLLGAWTVTGTVFGGGAEDGVTPPAASDDGSSSAGVVRVVTPGERVTVKDDTKIWLATDGLHSEARNVPGGPPIKITGSTDASRQPQMWGDPDGTWTAFGIYKGKGEAARVRVESARSGTAGTILTLAGTPGWGGWYAVVKPPAGSKAKAALSENIPRRFTVYDATGKVIASQEIGQ